MKTKAAVIFAIGGRFEIEDLELEGPHEGEVLVRLAAAGVCRSDHHLQTGDTRHPLPVVAGHEGAGVVEEVGPGVSDLRSGDHVILSWAPDCGRCFHCRRGRPALCETYGAAIWDGVFDDGRPRLAHRGRPVHHYCGLAAFAERCVVRRASCVPVRPEISLASAALVGCAVATGVGAVIHTAGVRAGESVAVLGAGGVGLNVLQGARLAGAHPVIAVDRAPGKLALARRFGATHTVESSAGGVDELRRLTGGRGPDHVFEAVGLAALQEAAVAAVRPGGTAVFVGLSPKGAATNVNGATLAREEKTIRGCYYGGGDAQRDFPVLVDLYAAGRLDLDSLVSDTCGLEQINEAFARLETGDVARTVIRFP